jgi:hypothetical protein
MAKPTTLDLLKAHAPITSVLLEVVEKVREDAKLSTALDAALKEPEHDNIRARFLSKRIAYEITLVFDAEPWKVA